MEKKVHGGVFVKSLINGIVKDEINLIVKNDQKGLRYFLILC